MIKQFTEKLENVGWFTEEHNLTYTHFDDAVYGKSTRIIAQNRDFVEKPTKLQMILPPTTNISIAQYLHTPFDTPEYSDYEDGDTLEEGEFKNSASPALRNQI